MAIHPQGDKEVEQDRVIQDMHQEILQLHQEVATLTATPHTAPAIEE